MSRPIALFGFLAAVIAALGGVALMKGGFYIAKHEGDTLHLLQILFRMMDGETPHLDFMTPLGILSFWPMVLVLKAGVGVGQAIILSQILVALVLLPAIFWAAYSRFDTALGYFFGLVSLVLILALVHGEAQPSLSISMHYNRWAWALAYVAIVLAVLPGMTARNPTLDGVIIGLALAALVLIKVTYVMAFGLPIVAALVLRGALRSLFVAFVAGVVVLAVVTLAMGVDFWMAYIQDILTVAASDTRPQPGAPLKAVIGEPQYLGGSLVLFMGVVLLRQAKQDVLGLVLLLLVPGFFYVTFQNFGNDPQWLMLLAILLLAPRPEAELVNGFGWNMPRALGVAAMAAIAFGAPSFLNLAYSPFRHASVSISQYSPILPRNAAHRDLQVRTVRSVRVDGKIGLDVPGSGLEAFAEDAKRLDSRVVFQGEVMTDCELELGISGWFNAVALDLEASGFGGSTIFAADNFNSLWIFGDIARTKGGAPWYYGGLPGIESADHLLVPICPASQGIRKRILEKITELGIEVREVHRTPLIILYVLTKG